MQTRKNFLSQSYKKIKALAFAGFSLPLFLRNIYAQKSSRSSYDIIAMRGGKGPGDLFLRGIEHLGGIKNFVKPGSTVLVKPNIGWDRTPDFGANTNPDLIRTIVESSIKAGASKVYVFDHTCDHWKNTYKNSGIEAAVKSAGGEIIPANSKSYYRETAIPAGVILKKALVHRVYLDADVVINVPVLKHHSSTMITASMKNLMGVIWDRYEWHRSGLHQCIADFASLRKPDLVVVDAYNVMTRNGPRGYSRSDLVNYRYLFISTNQVAADAASSMVLAQTSGIKKPQDIGHINFAEKAGLGSADLASLNIKRIVI